MSARHEIHSPDGGPRPEYAALQTRLDALSPAELRGLGDRMDATLREMGVTFDLNRDSPWGQTPWKCDLLPHVFSSSEWSHIVRGVRQRLRAFEMFLRDIYTHRRILRDNVIPVQPVLGSPYYQNASIGLPLPANAYLHLCGLHLTRDAAGEIAVKQHHFGHASGISYMMQNRRALARVMPEIFQDAPVQPLASAPLAIMEALREVAGSGEEPTIVLLSPGAENASHAKHSFLARRMGIPLVQGGDLLVLDDCVHLRTVQGLERVHVIFNRVADGWLDPLVFRKETRWGVPGLVHCVRKGTVKLINAIGAQLTDDRSLLCHSRAIIRYYLGEEPILRTVPTRWLGDIDQREHVLENGALFHVRSILGDEVLASAAAPSRQRVEQLQAEIRRRGDMHVAQPSDLDGTTLCYERGRQVERRLDHIIFAVRRGDDFDVFPGALTRTFPAQRTALDPEAEWASKDTWVLSPAEGVPLVSGAPRRWHENELAASRVTSRVAEAFYWMGRYLERAHHQAYLIQAIETLETEELNSAERKLYRPMWDRLLPPLDTPGPGRRSISTPLDRYRQLLSREPGTVARAIQRARDNAQSVQGCMSPEALAVLNQLQARFARVTYREAPDAAECERVTRRLSEVATGLIPQFNGVAANTMLLDDGWRFCIVGQALERAITTANAVAAIGGAFTTHDPADTDHATEIRLSAFLRLLGTRDAYRRIYQMRTEPIPVLELLWQSPRVPRSVLYCLQKCGALLREAMAQEDGGAVPAIHAIEELIRIIKRINWDVFLGPDQRRVGDSLDAFVGRMLSATMEVHTLISDSFLSHQARISQRAQPFLEGFRS